MCGQHEQNALGVTLAVANLGQRAGVGAHAGDFVDGCLHVFE